MADAPKTIDPAVRYSRQKELVPAQRLATCTITIVGVGAIGRQIALQLAAMGVPSLQLVDFDVVDESNLASQGYLQDDLGRFKIDATADQCMAINHQLAVTTANERFRRSMDIGNVLFVAVDRIEIRQLIWNSVKDRVSVFIDTRMSAEVVRVLTAADEAGRQHYPSTLFTAEEAHVGSCTAKSTIYTANIAAGLAIGQFTKWLRNLPVDRDISLNILTNEMDVG